jgi:hypothetical protein
MEFSIKEHIKKYNEIDDYYKVVECEHTALMLTVSDKYVNYDIPLYRLYMDIDNNDWITAHQRADDYCMENKYGGFASDLVKAIHKEFNLTYDDFDIVYKNDDNDSREWIYNNKAKRLKYKIDEFYSKWVVNEWCTHCDALILKNSKGEYKYIILKYYFKRGAMNNEDYKIYYEGGNYTIIRKRW